MAEINIGYFLEDIGQEEFIRVLVKRIIEERKAAIYTINHHLRNATGGKGEVTTELKWLLRDIKKGKERPFDMLIVAIDANCDAYSEKKNQITCIKDQTNYQGFLVCAIPDPHIEHWYLADPTAISKVIGTTSVPQVPQYKCEKDRYKQAIKKFLRDNGIQPSLVSAYGFEIARAMNIYDAGKNAPALKHFIADLKNALAHFIS